MTHMRGAVKSTLTAGGWVVLAGLLLALAARSAEATPAVRQVLLLQSFDRGKLAFDYVSDNFRRELERRPDEPVNFVQFVVSPAGFAVPPEDDIVDFLQSAFADRPKPDLIVTIWLRPSRAVPLVKPWALSIAPLSKTAIGYRR